jgi:hypothetical protein
MSAYLAVSSVARSVTPSARRWSSSPWPEIERRFGSGGIRAYAPAYGGLGRITDDTQMTLFTAEGLIRAHHRRL